MVTTTDNHGLNKYSQGEDNWDHSDTVDAVEVGKPIRDVESNVGNYTAHPDAWFWATDSGAVYTADGSSWAKVADFVSREDIRDLVAGFVSGGTNVTVTHDDGNDVLTITGDVQSIADLDDVYKQDTEPSNPNTDDLWFDTS